MIIATFISLAVAALARPGKRARPGPSDGPSYRPEYNKVFDVMSGKEQPSSCDMLKEHDQLDIWFGYIDRVNWQARWDLVPQQLEDDADTRNLALATYGIRTFNGKAPDSRIHEQALDAERLKIAQDLHVAVGVALRKVSTDYKKPRLLCDTKHMVLQDPDKSQAMDPATGKPRKDSSGKSLTLKAYETKMGRAQELAHFDYFWVDIPSEYASPESKEKRERFYRLVQKADKWPVDEKGRADLCGTQVRGITEFPLDHYPDIQNTQHSTHVIICADAIVNIPSISGHSYYKGEHHGTPLSKAAPYWDTLFHELFHWAGDRSLVVDVPVLLPDMSKSAQSWPGDRSSWQAFEKNINFGRQSMLVALYDLATKGKPIDLGRPELKDKTGKLAVGSPENLVTFAVANYMQFKSESAWWTGLQEPKGQPFRTLTRDDESDARYRSENQAIPAEGGKTKRSSKSEKLNG